eukprot:gnl/Trimastix_PCT/1248.p1 GENE.gnl/Trimastix_PCT/1248~~gnl/Trimastix_PCT/1248.p1  ORF type:complete len:602 (+),score=167.59 gnl/Trimastix_PCT/1248:57-1808(+)
MSEEATQDQFNRITEMLVAAGYFKARIPGLTPFDRVVGGVAWCITASNVYVDVDVLFNENPRVGEKIKIAENIIKALRQMRCPIPVQPHQIQGLDFSHLFHVVQWLVKAVIEIRSASGDSTKIAAVNQFHRTCGNWKCTDPVKEGCDFLQAVGLSYAPGRQFKHRPFARTPDIETHVQTTLLEYGRRTKISSRALETKEDEGPSARRAIASKLEDSQKTETAAEEEEKRIHQLMSHMSSAQGDQVSMGTLGSLVGMGTDEIRAAADEYSEAQRQQQTQSKFSAANAMRQQIDALTKQIAEEETKLEALQASLSEARVSHEEARTQLEALQTRLAALREELEQLKQAESAQDAGLVARLHQLISLNSTFTQQEDRFKAHCRQELGKWRARVQELEAKQVDTEESQNAQLRAQLDSDREKADQIRSLLATRNRQVALLRRQIDEIPTRTELVQYQARFVELYDTVSMTLEETRKFFTRFNTLSEKKEYLEREVSLLQSIQENFAPSMRNKGTQKAFIENVEKVVQSVVANLERVHSTRDSERACCDIKAQQYAKIVEDQRRYFKLVKQFQEECTRNEYLQTLSQQ